MKTATLTNGIVIEAMKSGSFPPLQQVLPKVFPCSVCPVEAICEGNNPFDCEVYGMFGGYYADTQSEFVTTGIIKNQWDVMEAITALDDIGSP